MDDIPSFGAWLKRRRKALDLTQEALARLVSCSVVSIRKFEGDEQRPSRQLAGLLAEHLVIPAADRSTFVQYARRGLDTAPPELPIPPAAELPNPASLSTAPTINTMVPTGNLPIRLASFIGRDREQHDIVITLQRSDVRLLTLTGPGGSGKTSLALTVATQLANAHPDGAWFVDLAPLRDPDLVISTIAQALDVRESGDQPLINRLQAVLRFKKLLLLLDNFEQVITAAPLVHALLSAAPRLTVLVTSREPLQLTGEHDYAVQPMVVPAADSATMHNQILAADAVRLFVARAQAARSDFVVTSADAPVLAAICRQLDGLPLAIELAAARVKVLPLPVLLARLDQRLAVLSSRTRDVPQRQQTIRATINWSYQLLEPAEQLLFRQLGVFVGGWSLGAVEAVCGDGSDNLVQLLEQLVEKSLVTPRIGIQDALRFNMLETIREFAIEQLTLHGELEQLQRRHAEYFLRLVEAAEPQLYGPDQKIWLDVIDQEHDNVRTVLTWSLAVGDTQAIGLQLASLLIYFWAVRSYAHEGVAWMKQLLELTIRGDLVLRAKALVAVGSLAENHSQLKEAIVYLEEAVSLYRNLEDDKGIALALMYIGRCKYWQTAYSEAQPLLAESLSHFQGLGDRTWMMWAFLSLGDCAFYGDDVRSAQRYFAQALELSQQLEDQHGYGWAMLCLSRTEWALTQNDLAHRHAHTALEVFQRLQQKTEAAHAELELARIAEGQDNLPAAYDWYARSLTQFSHQRLQRVPECLEGISSLIVRVAPDRATRMLGAAFTLRVAISIPLPLIYRAAYERSIAEARAALSAESFDAAFAAGQALTLDDAVAEALEMAVLKASAAN